MKLGLHVSSFLPIALTQWVNRGLHDVPAEFLNFPIPEDGLNVTGNVFNWFEEKMNEENSNKIHQKHNRGPSPGGFGGFAKNNQNVSDLIQARNAITMSRFQISLPLLSDYVCRLFQVLKLVT